MNMIQKSPLTLLAGLCLSLTMLSACMSGLIEPATQAYPRPLANSTLATLGGPTTASSIGNRIEDLININKKVKKSIAPEFIPELISTMHPSSVSTPPSDPTSIQPSQEDELGNLHIKWLPNATQEEKKIVKRYMDLGGCPGYNIPDLPKKIDATNQYGQTALILAIEKLNSKDMDFFFKRSKYRQCKCSLEYSIFCGEYYIF